jgi:hypothetical protein
VAVAGAGPRAAFQVHGASGRTRRPEFNRIDPAVARKEWELNQRDHRKLLIVAAANRRAEVIVRSNGHASVLQRTDARFRSG